jgi:protein phosphatase
MKLRHSARTDVGRTRDHNEDDFGIGEGAQVDALGSLFVVCDGMGGYAAGEVASQVGVETIVSSFYGDSADDRTMALEQAFERANERIHAEGRGNMGTTGVAALFHHDALYIANVGDSRAYLIRNAEIRQISRDHSLVGEQVAAGLISPDQARSLNYRNVITRALGYQSEVEVDVFRLPLQKADIVVLTTDGLHTLVEDREIAEMLAGEPIENAVERLVDMANERGGQDNITVLAISVDELDWTTETADDSQAADPSSATTDEMPVLSAAAAPAPATAPAATPARPASVERRLSLLGGLLALLLLTVLVFAILFAQRATPEPETVPGATATAVTVPTLTPTR